MDFLSIADLTAPQLEVVLARAAAVKTDPGAAGNALDGLSVGLFFEKPSLRTRVSCELAALETGARPLVLKQDEVGLGSREAVSDVARVLDRYLDVLAFRVFHHTNLEELARHAAAPVINLLSDLEHPCQALADLQTIAEHRPLQGARVAFLGDGNNVCHSLILGAALTGTSVSVATPPGFEPRPEVVGRVRDLGGDVTITNEPDEAVEGADVVYTDVWASMGQEAQSADRKLVMTRFRVDGRLFERAAPDAVFLHCLPAHRGEEVTDDVMDHPRSRVFDQAENRLHSFKAILLHVLER